MDVVGDRLLERSCTPLASPWLLSGGHPPLSCCDVLVVACLVCCGRSWRMQGAFGDWLDRADAVPRGP